MRSGGGAGWGRGRLGARDMAAKPLVRRRGAPESMAAGGPGQLEARNVVDRAFGRWRGVPFIAALLQTKKVINTLKSV